MKNGAIRGAGLFDGTALTRRDSPLGDAVMPVLALFVPETEMGFTLTSPGSGRYKSALDDKFSLVSVPIGRYVIYETTGNRKFGQ